MTALATRSARGGIATVASQGGGLVVRMAALFVLARFVEPSAFGLIAIAQAIALFASSCALMGLGMATIRERDLSHETQSSLFWLQSGIGLTLGLVMCAGAQPLAAAYGHPKLQSITLWLSLLPLLNGMQAQYRADLSRNLRFIALSMSEFLPLVAAVTISIVMAANGFTYSAVIAQLIAQPVIQLLYLIATTKWLPSLRFHWSADARRIVYAGFHILLMNLTRNLARTVQTPLMAFRIPSNDLGFYDRSQQLVVAPVNAMVEQMQRVAVPVFSRIRTDPSATVAYLRRCQTLILLGPGTVFALAASVAPDLITALLGSQWGNASLIFALLCVGGSFRMLGQTMDWIFISAKDTRRGVIFSLWSQPAIIIISLLGLPWGAAGVAAGNLVALALYWPAATVLAARLTGFRTRALLAPAALTIATVTVPLACVGLVVRNALAASLGAGAPIIAVISGTAVASAAALATRHGRVEMRAVLSTVRTIRGHGAS